MDRRHHLTIYGATGFTAKIIIAELLRGRPTRWPPAFKWSIAGRNAAALERLRAGFNHGNTANTSSIPLPDIIVADVRDQKSLNNMARQTRCTHTFLSSDFLIVNVCSAAQLCRTLP